MFWGEILHCIDKNTFEAWREDNNKCYMRSEEVFLKKEKKSPPPNLLVTNKSDAKVFFVRPYLSNLPQFSTTVSINSCLVFNYMHYDCEVFHYVNTTSSIEYNISFHNERYKL